jgi:5-methylcytosine-specific restriction endonuclease McrA
MNKRNCLTCNKEFKTHPWELKNGFCRFCSRKCSGEWQSKNLIREKSHLWKGGPVNCICKICNKEFTVPKAHLKRGRGKFCSHKCKGIWQRENLKKENNPNWTDGRTPENHRIRNSIEYKNWRKSVYERDNYTCQICGDNRGGNLNANHIKKFSDFPAIRLDINNGITLCEHCHISKVTHYEEKYEIYFISKIRKEEACGV